jgi:hypothetical protein
MTTVFIKNTEPCWVEYGFEVEVPDGLSDEESKERAMELLHDNREHLGVSTVKVTSGPEVQGQIDGMDQEFEVTEVVR